MKVNNITLNSNDIIADNGNGVYILTQNEKEISREDFEEISNSCFLTYDRRQWGVDQYLVGDKINKKELNQNIHLSEGNIKSKSTDDVLFLTWSIPCKVTCPYSTEMCRKRCFAQKNQYFSSVLASRERNLEETKKDTFARDMIKWFEYYLQSSKATGKRIFVRIHTSGDFYNEEYLDKWRDIANYFKGNDKILFQAYTKSIQYVWNWIVGDLEEEFVDDIEVEDALEDLNIHLVYSIWKDTDEGDIEIATDWIGLQTFTALPKKEIEDKKGVFICEGDCGNCKQCYTGKAKEIVIPIH